MFSKLKREVKILLFSVAIGLVFALCMAAYTFVYAGTVQRNIADNVIRFHVVANSDSHADQILKDIVRDEVLVAFEGRLNAAENIKESRQMLKSELPAIQAHAEQVVRDLGFDYPVAARLDVAFFPTQRYGDLSFPPGMYEAVQITIGNGNGKNWWCLMFPPLCFVEMTGTENGRRQLSENVSDDAFLLLVHEEAGLEVRFRIVEWWQNRRRP